MRSDWRKDVDCTEYDFGQMTQSDVVTEWNLK